MGRLVWFPPQGKEGCPDKVGGPEDISNHLITDRGRAGEDGVRPKARYTTLTTKGGEKRGEKRQDKLYIFPSRHRILLMLLLCNW
jgi:hypothetical protein